MTEHKWKADRDGAESCEREGCTVRRSGVNVVHWQKKPKATWRRESSEPIPPCTGKDAEPDASAFAQPVTIYANGSDGLWHATTATYPNEAETRCGRRITASELSTALDACAKRCPCANPAPNPAPSPLEVVREYIRTARRLMRSDDLPSADAALDETLSALATLEESIRKDEREKCARDVDTVATGYGSLQRQALAQAARELRIRNRK